jgi:hypothetical protein
MFNGTYSPSIGRPTSLVKDIGEKMVKNHRDLYAPQPMENAIGDEVRFPPKETLRTYGPEPSPEYPSAREHLDDLFKALELLEMETSALFAQIDNALAEVTETDCEPRPGPRISNSNLTYRIAHAADLIDELTNRVNLIRRRVTL